MPTDNPKVSAYVPRHVFDKLKEFYEDRKLSMSQAVTLILSEYFEVDPSTKPLHNSISQRLEDLERKLTQVNELHSRLLSELEERVEDLTKDIHKNPEVFSELPIELGGELPLLDYLVDTNQGQGELLIELPEKDFSEVPAGLLSDSPIEMQPISGLKLSKLRFGLSKDALAGVKRKMTLQEFTRWTKEKDPDAIAWKYVENPVKGYIPAEDLLSESKSKLLKWIKENIKS